MVNILTMDLIVSETKMWGLAVGTFQISVRGVLVLLHIFGYYYQDGMDVYELNLPMMI